MKKLFMTGLIITGLAFTGASMAWAYPQGQSMCSKCAEKAKTCKVTKLKNKAKILWENKEELGLKEDQLDKIKDIKHAAIKGLIQRKADLDIVMVDLNSAKHADAMDVQAVNTLLDAKYDVKKETAKAYVKAVSDIQQVLSKDQHSQWKELMKKAKHERECAKCPYKSGKYCPFAEKSKTEKK